MFMQVFVFDGYDTFFVDFWVVVSLIYNLCISMAMNNGIADYFSFICCLL